MELKRINTKDIFFEEAKLEWFSTCIPIVSGIEFNKSLSLYNNGIEDDLDSIEFIMEIEKVYDVAIADDISDFILNNFESIMSHLISIDREEKLNKIL